MQAENLRTEYLYNPIGIDIRRPRFYWTCSGGKKQTAYRIIASRISTCGSEKEIVWDSGKVISDSMTHIRYEGKKLKSRDCLEWTVTLWDDQDIEETSEIAFFEMGLLDLAEWKAKFISGDYKPDNKRRYPVDYFKKCIVTSKEKTIARARIYATAFGVYDVSINSELLTDHYLAPGITDYRKRLQYQVTDITDRIMPGTNEIEIRLADGWYRGSCAAYGVTNVYGKRTSVMVQLEVIYSDGTVDTIITDGSWDWCNDGPIRFADLKDGELVDASFSPSYSGKAKVVPFEKNVKDTKIVASNNVPVKKQEEFSAKLLRNSDGSVVYDFGQNIAGIIDFEVQAKKGTGFKLVCGEVLDDDGHVDLSGIQERRPQKGWNKMSLITKLVKNTVNGISIGTPLQTVEYITSGRCDHYTSAFTVLGFRYAELVGDVVIEEKDIKAIAVYSDLERAGSFSCSNELVNKLHENTVWSMKGNYLDIPTDCPTRERLGWTGDGQIFFNTGAYMMNIAPFMRKWMMDMEDARYKNGLVPAVFPYEGVEMMYKATGTSVGWADVLYLLPYRFYKSYGDKELLSEHYASIMGYADYLMKNLGLTDKRKAKDNPDNAFTYEKGVHLGEWLEPEEFRDAVYGAGAKHPEECTAYLYLAMTTIEEIARILGKTDDAEKCHKYAIGAKRSYENLFVKGDRLKTDRQAKIVRPLALGLLDSDSAIGRSIAMGYPGTGDGIKEKNRAQLYLREAVQNYNYCVGTGFLSTVFLLPVLTAAGYIDVAYKTLENEEKPGWLSEIKEGATTVWENWEGNLSQNHYSPGAVCEWLYNTVCGIRVTGENSFEISPIPGGTLTFASASYRSIYGEVKSSWEKQNGKTLYKIEIPSNTTAIIKLPESTAKELSCGKYEFCV